MTQKKSRSNWQDDAACLGYDTNLWFPETPQGRDYFAKAREICKNCKVADECLDFALSFDADNDRFGMFGGKSPKERYKLRDKAMRVDIKSFVTDVKVAVRTPFFFKYAMLSKYTPYPTDRPDRRTRIDMKKTEIPAQTRLVMFQTSIAPASALTAQASAALIMAGWEDPLDATTCAALFMGASYVMELARIAGENGTLTPQESAAAQGIAELAMQVWNHHAQHSKETV